MLPWPIVAMAANNERTGFDMARIPYEIWTSIAYFCSFDDVCTLRQVSSHLNAVLAREVIRHVKVISYQKDIAEYLDMLAEQAQREEHDPRYNDPKGRKPLANIE